MIETPQELKELLYSWKLIKQNDGKAYVGTLVTSDRVYYDYGACDPTVSPLNKSNIKQAWCINKANCDNLAEFKQFQLAAYPYRINR